MRSRKMKTWRGWCFLSIESGEVLDSLYRKRPTPDMVNRGERVARVEVREVVKRKRRRSK